VEAFELVAFADPEGVVATLRTGHTPRHSPGTRRMSKSSLELITGPSRAVRMDRVSRPQGIQPGPLAFECFDLLRQSLIEIGEFEPTSVERGAGSSDCQTLGAQRDAAEMVGRADGHGDSRCSCAKETRSPHTQFQHGRRYASGWNQILGPAREAIG